MIRELLRPEAVLLDLPPDYPRAIDTMLRASARPQWREETRARLLAEDRGPPLFLGDGILVPHVRLPGLPGPEILIGVAPAGLALGGRTARLVLLLATPEEQPDLHLQILQRLAAILPESAPALIAARDAGGMLRILGEAERQAGVASYLNLGQDLVAFELRTDLRNGLGETEAARRLAVHGRNVLRRAARTPWPVRLARNLFGFFALLLWVAALLCFLPGVGMPQLGLAILVVIVVNGVFAFLQENRSDRAVEVLERLLAPHARVWRDGRLRDLDASLLVPGDVIHLGEGDVVPADARLIEADEVEVDTSTLTGESASARRYKSDRPVLLTGRFLWIEIPNMVFAGTALVRGDARAVVFATGMRTEIGKIAGMTQAIRAEESPLQKQLRGTVRAIALLAASIGAGCLFLGWLLGGLSFAQALVFCIGMFVANVPEGLMPTVTLSLAMGVTRMARRNAIVRSLSSVETLGCTTVICCDKTGTLTRNQMQVETVYVDGRHVRITGAGYAPEGRFLLDGVTLPPEAIAGRAALRWLLECAFVCNNARLEKTDRGWGVLGDQTEGALLALAAKAGFRGTHQRLHANPFESVRKRMSVVARPAGQEAAAVFAKGAPLELLQRCDRILEEGARRPLDAADRRRITAANDRFASSGLRVLALAFRDDPGEESAPRDVESVESRLIFLGLAALSDPIRPGVPEAVAACRGAGIRVVMITGDYGLTAATIARQVGIAPDRPRVATGAEVGERDDAALRELVRAGVEVFARVSPEHKLRIVAALQSMGEIVAVTGDGVNDAPALKKADVGIAMGLRGNEVAREAADLVLADDNFGTIVAAIEEGRAVWDNIRRFSAYVFNSNPQEMYPYVLWMLVPGMPLAMTIMGVLAVDVGTDLIPAMGLGIEPPEPGILRRPPRRRDERLLSTRFILRAYFHQGSLLAISCFATWLYMGRVLGVWTPGRPLTGMPASPPGLRLEEATRPYLMTLTAYFFPTVTTQIANVLCKRSSRASLFSRDFLEPARRGAQLRSIAAALPPLTAAPARFLERHPILFNFVSNPIVDLGIASELLLCLLFFYTPLSRIYGFAPVPWHVYLFAWHGFLLLLFTEEARKFLQRRRRAPAPPCEARPLHAVRGEEREDAPGGGACDARTS